MQNSISLPVKRFLLIDECPAEWKDFNLYLFRDHDLAFYVGKSHLAFGRVWEHLLGGFKGHSIVGRFIWCNWPASMNFTIELMSSRQSEFGIVGHDLDKAEEFLIERWTPCFNVSLNTKPHAVPDHYLPPNTQFRRRRSLKALIREAKLAVNKEETEAWLKSIEE